MKKGFATLNAQLQAIAAWQKEKRRKKGISPSADGEEGYAPSTAQAFEKA